MQIISVYSLFLNNQMQVNLSIKKWVKHCYEVMNNLFFCIFLDLRNNSYVPPSARYKNWGSVCYGKKVRGICINGIGDLKKITKKRALFVNKFHLNYQYLALDCLEEWLFNRTSSYYTSQAVI